MDKFLAFDCSSELIIVGCFDGKTYYETTKKASGTEQLLPTIDETLKKASLDIKDIKILGVGVGPGSWTGSRVAVVTAFGLANGKNKLKLLPFNSFDLFSYNNIETATEKNKIELVKAYANFVYAKVNGAEPACITYDQLKQDFDGYVKYSVEELPVETTLCTRSLFDTMTKLISKKCFKKQSEIEPMYLRLSQAELQLQQKQLKDKK